MLFKKYGNTFSIWIFNMVNFIIIYIIYYYKTMVRLFDYFSLIFGNIIYGFRTGSKTRNFVDIVPTSKTFSIWTTIYRRLFLFSLSNNSTPNINKLFSESNSYNINWLKLIANSDSNNINDTDKSNSLNLLINLKETIKEILDEYGANVESYEYTTFKIYYTWVTVAGLLQEDTKNNSNSSVKQRIKDIVLNKEIGRNEYIYEGVIVWAVSGLYNKYKDNRKLIIHLVNGRGFDINKIKKQGKFKDYITL